MHSSGRIRTTGADRNPAWLVLGRRMGRFSLQDGAAADSGKPNDLPAKPGGIGDGLAIALLSLGQSVRETGFCLREDLEQRALVERR